MDQILALGNIEAAPEGTKFYFNCATVEHVRVLQNELKAAGLDQTVLCRAPPHRPECIYYTPKSARLGPGGWHAEN